MLIKGANTIGRELYDIISSWWQFAVTAAVFVLCFVTVRKVSEGAPALALAAHAAAWAGIVSTAVLLGMGYVCRAVFHVPGILPFSVGVLWVGAVVTGIFSLLLKEDATVVFPLLSGICGLVVWIRYWIALVRAL